MRISAPTDARGLDWGVVGEELGSDFVQPFMGERIPVRITRDSIAVYAASPNADPPICGDCFTMAAMSAAKTKTWRPLYERYGPRGGLSGTATLVILARRIARAAWSICR